MQPQAASLLDVNPSLRRALGPGPSARLGHRRILPVLSIPAGTWSARPAATFGAGTRALGVIDGFLLAEGRAQRRVLGPGDTLTPWTGERGWTACTAARVAVLGPVFLDALSPWPGVAAALLAAPEAGAISDRGPLEERLLSLLWQLARRWGALWAGGIALPASVDTRALAVLADAAPPAAELILAELEARGALGRRPTGGWTLPGSGAGVPRERHEALRARVAEQFALARAGFADLADVCDELEDERRRHTSPGGRLAPVATDVEDGVDP